MKLIRQYWEFEEMVDGAEILKKIERAGRTCYKSEDKITDDSATRFCLNMLKSGHHSVIGHHNITVRIITNRGVTHEIVRHRLVSYSQESTRYCNYGGDDLVFILPVWMDNYPVPLNQSISFLEGPVHLTAEESFLYSLHLSEIYYKYLLKESWQPQQAREVLPNALKTELVMTANIREWRHFFSLRCSSAAHPQMRDLAKSMLTGFYQAIPAMFDDLYGKHIVGGE
jgi:thymidylate synthase (FAD)